MTTTLQSIASQFGCTTEQLRRQYAKNAKQLSAMADKAERTGKKVNSYTSAQLRIMAAQALTSAA